MMSYFLFWVYHLSGFCQFLLGYTSDMYLALQELGNAQQEAGRAHKAAEAKAREAGPGAPSNLHEAQARLAGMNSSFLLSSQIVVCAFLYDTQNSVKYPILLSFKIMCSSAMFQSTTTVPLLQVTLCLLQVITLRGV